MFCYYIFNYFFSLALDLSLTNFPLFTLYTRTLQNTGLDHNVDTSGQSVIVSKTKHSRVPERRFQEYLNSPPLELYSTGRTGGPDSRPSASCQPHWTSDPAMLSVKKLNILKRDNSKEKDDKDNTSGRTCWLSDGCGNKAFHGLEGRRCRSMEEREEHYNLVRYVS